MPLSGRGWGEGRVPGTRELRAWAQRDDSLPCPRQVRRGGPPPRQGAVPHPHPPSPAQGTNRHRAGSVPPRDKGWAATAAPGSARGSPQGTLAVRRVWEGVRAPPPLPRRAPGNLLIKIATAPALRVRPLPPSPGGGRSSLPPSLAPQRGPKRQPSVWRPSKHRRKNPGTPDSSHLGVSSPRPLPTASLLRRRRRQQLLLEAARDPPPSG